jgi:LemA protein
MDYMTYVIIGLILIALYVLSFFNRTKTALIHIGASVQEIGNQLKRQADLIPNIIQSAKAYLKHEKSIFEELTSARKLIDRANKTRSTKDLDISQKMISSALKSLHVVVESNPEIKASEVVKDLMSELRDTSDKLMYARRTLIDLSADYNVSIETFPGLLLAPIFGFKKEKGLQTPSEGEFIKVTKEETKTPKVDL